jgi:phage-related protein
MKLRLVRRSWWTLYAVCTDRGACPLLDFLHSGVQVTSQGLRPKGPVANEKVRMLARLDAVAQDGPPRNAKICHQIEEDLWQIELGRIRVLWFYDAGRIILLSHGFLKSTQKTPEAEKRMAREALKRYREAKATNSIEFMED